MQRCWDQDPQQNGVAERKNRTILEVVKTMIHDQDLPMCLWEEAAMAAVYVQNRLPHSALGLKTPEKMFTGKKLEVSHLKIFGCPVFIHIPKEKRNKLEPSGKKEYLWDTVRSPRPSESTYLVTATLRSAGT
jgi:hypothetical protein